MSRPGRLETESIRSSALWHVYDFNPQQGTARLLQLTEPDYRSASFLDQRVEPLASDHAEVTLKELESALASQAGNSSGPPEAQFIFHHGHCGSTLLSRALAASGKVLPLREPLTLRRLARGPNSDQLLHLAVRAHSRTFHPQQCAMVKATSTCNSLIGPILSAFGQSRAILMYVPLESFLAGMLGKQTPALDLKGHAASRLADWNRIDGAPALDPEKLDEAQLAVLAWLSCLNLMLSASRDFPDRARMFNFEEWLDRPEAGLEQSAGYFGLENEHESILAAWPDVSTAYSKKPDEPYSAFNRRKTLQRGRQFRGEEIRRGLAWARELLSRAPVLEKTAAYFGD